MQPTSRRSSGDVGANLDCPDLLPATSAVLCKKCSSHPDHFVEDSVSRNGIIFCSRLPRVPKTNTSDARRCSCAPMFLQLCTGGSLWGGGRVLQNLESSQSAPWRAMISLWEKNKGVDGRCTVPCTDDDGLKHIQLIGSSLAIMGWRPYTLKWASPVDGLCHTLFFVNPCWDQDQGVRKYLYRSQRQTGNATKLYQESRFFAPRRILCRLETPRHPQRLSLSGSLETRSPLNAGRDSIPLILTFQAWSRIGCGASMLRPWNEGQAAMCTRTLGGFGV